MAARRTASFRCSLVGTLDFASRTFNGLCTTADVAPGLASFIPTHVQVPETSVRSSVASFGERDSNSFTVALTCSRQQLRMARVAEGDSIPEDDLIHSLWTRLLFI